MLDLQEFIRLSLEEDFGSGDHTSLSCIPKGSTGSAELLVKADGVLAGVNLACSIFKQFDPEITFEKILEDGTSVQKGTLAFKVHGSIHTLLGCERLALNCMQRMSGIATKVAGLKKMILAYPAKILDTRKTTPGIRAIEKWAVKIGGGENHRFALYDMIMLKDNHNDFAGGIPQAIAKTKQYLIDNNKDLKIIVEARNLDEVQQILDAGGVYRILLDNFDYETTKKAVAMIGNQCLTESSGNINERTIRHYAECGVNYISSGALTHSVYNMDLSLKAI